VGDVSVTLVCQTFQVSRSSVYAARKAAVENSEPGRTKRIRSPRVAAPELVAAIRAILDDQPAWGHRKIWATLRRQREGFNVYRVSRRRVYEILRAEGWTLPGTTREPQSTRGHVTVPEPNRRIAADMTTLHTRRGGVVAVVLTVDCGCRSVLNVTATKAQTAPAVLGPVEQGLIAAFGDRSNVGDAVELRTDHGPQFTGADADALAGRWGIVQTFAPVGRPTGNAVAERTIQTMKVECLWLQDFDDVEDVQRALDHWQEMFNDHRPHQSLGWRTPAEFRAEKLGTPPTKAAA